MSRQCRDFFTRVVCNVILVDHGGGPEQKYIKYIKINTPVSLPFISPPPKPSEKAQSSARSLGPVGWPNRSSVVENVGCSVQGKKKSVEKHQKNGKNVYCRSHPKKKNMFLMVFNCPMGCFDADSLEFLVLFKSRYPQSLGQKENS